MLSMLDIEFGGNVADGIDAGFVGRAAVVLLSGVVVNEFEGFPGVVGDFDVALVGCYKLVLVEDNGGGSEQFAIFSNRVDDI